VAPKYAAAKTPRSYMTAKHRVRATISPRKLAFHVAAANNSEDSQIKKPLLECRPSSSKQQGGETANWIRHVLLFVLVVGIKVASDSRHRAVNHS